MYVYKSREKKVTDIYFLFPLYSMYLNRIVLLIYWGFHKKGTLSYLCALRMDR